jgi:predicted ATPase with chaperone activity
MIFDTAPHHTIFKEELPWPTAAFFLNESPELHQQTLDVLPQPLEDQFIAIACNAEKVQFCYCLILIAAMNLSLCDFLGSQARMPLFSGVQSVVGFAHQ